MVVQAPTRCPGGVSAAKAEEQSAPTGASSATAGGGGTQPEVVQGFYTAPVDGLCCFTWDNTYSRLRGKQVGGRGVSHACAHWMAGEQLRRRRLGSLALLLLSSSFFRCSSSCRW